MAACRSVSPVWRLPRRNVNKKRFYLVMSVFQVHNNCAEYIQKIQKASLTPVTSQIQLLADEKVGLTCSCTF